jgi:hypothetical protein
MSEDRFKALGVEFPTAPAGEVPKPDRFAELGVRFEDAAKPPAQSSSGVASLLPESVQQYVPSFLKGPSALEQETTSLEKVGEEEKKLGRPLTLAERLKQSPAMESPVAAGFATHQIGETSPELSTMMAKSGKKFIEGKSYDKAVKPPTSVASNATQAADYKQHIGNSINSIIDNKPNLQFVDQQGTRIEGELPKTMEQFRDAISQTKEEVFKKYDGMVQRGEIAGIAIPMDNVAGELSTIASDKVTNAIHPEIARYAEAKADALAKVGSFTPTEAQRAIQQLNESLTAFYKNPSYETARRAGVDAMVANVLRRDLDSAIATSVEPGYQALKNEYGSLSAIEKHVTRGAQRVANQEAGGGLVGRLADVASAEEVLRGIFTLSPRSIMQGAFLKAASQIVKWWRNPNRAVKQLFDTAEKLKNPPATQPPIVPNIPVSPFMLTNQPTNIDQMVQQSGQ